MITNPTASNGRNAGYKPYYNVQGHVEFITGGLPFQIFIANGYDANGYDAGGGMIGTERNGIVLVDPERRQIIFDEWKNCGSCSMGETPAQQQELHRIVNMDAVELNEFFSTAGLRLCYNPFTEIKLTKKMKKSKVDIGMAKTMTFTDAKFDSAKEKKSTARAWELFLVKRLAMSPILTETEEALMLGAFTKGLYDFWHLRTGHIAHFNRGGFFSAQLCDLHTLIKNVDRVAQGISLYGYPMCSRDGDKDDIIAAISKISKYYLPALRILAAREQEVRDAAEIEDIKARADKHGMKVVPE